MRSFIVGVLIAVSTTIGSELPQSADPLYDRTKRTLEQHAETNFGSSEVMQIMLLKSSQPSDLPWLYEVQLLIVRGQRVVFDYIKPKEKKGRTDSDLKFFVDNLITIQDVT